MSLNIYEYKNKKIFLLYITTRAVAIYHVILLYIFADKTLHYVLEKNVSRLVLRQYNNNNKFFYSILFVDCISKEVLKYHLGRCKLHRTQRIKVLEADNQKGRDEVKFTKIE